MVLTAMASRSSRTCDGESRAYPIQILMWHEIVNDTIAGVPVTVSYCPLCNSAVAYDRRIDDRIVDFGTSGSLWNSALVMYDRQTETLWSHFTAEGLVGELTGVRLDTLPVATVPWGAWRDANPDALVLSTETGFNRNYGRNPYPGYDNIDSSPFLFSGEVDGTFAAMTRIVGIERDDDTLAVPLFRLQEERVVEAAVGDTDVVAFWTLARHPHSMPVRSPTATTSVRLGCSSPRSTATRSPSPRTTTSSSTTRPVRRGRSSGGRSTGHLRVAAWSASSTSTRSGSPGRRSSPTAP